MMSKTSKEDPEEIEEFEEEVATDTYEKSRKCY